MGKSTINGPYYLVAMYGYVTNYQGVDVIPRAGPCGRWQCKHCNAYATRLDVEVLGTASNSSDINVVMFKFQNWMVGNILGHTNIDAHNCDFR
jgi:hypothetical protein